ncbi:MAG: YHS domain-containing protein [Candidatus Hydrothermarchaeales archaeon]
MAKDPICNMDVDEATAEHTSEHEGQTYYFCAAGCKTSFEENPEKFLKGAAAEEKAEMKMPEHAMPREEAKEKPWWKFW